MNKSATSRRHVTTVHRLPNSVRKRKYGTRQKHQNDTPIKLTVGLLPKAKYNCWGKFQRLSRGPTNGAPRQQMDLYLYSKSSILQTEDACRQY